MSANKTKSIYTIRRVKINDRPQIKKLLKVYPKAVLSHHLPPEKDSIAAVLKDGKIIGHAGLDISATKMAEIRSLVVDKNYQGMGVAGRMVEELEKPAHKRKLWVLFADTVAVKFFKKFGYKPPKKNSEVLFKYF
jgi:N-acetylglutamate synthase-like GNAT family acetyltransferase